MPTLNVTVTQGQQSLIDHSVGLTVTPKQVSDFASSGGVQGLMEYVAATVEDSVRSHSRKVDSQRDRVTEVVSLGDLKAAVSKLSGADKTKLQALVDWLENV